MSIDLKELLEHRKKLILEIESNKLSDLEQLNRGEITQSQYESRIRTHDNKIRMLLSDIKHELTNINTNFQARIEKNPFKNAWLSPLLISLSVIITLIDMFMRSSDNLAPILENIFIGLEELVANIGENIV